MHKIKLLLICGLLLSHDALADIYKYVDENGRITYSNIPVRGGKKLNLEPLSTIPASRPRPAAAVPAGFPKVDGETQKKRDDTRRQILEDELAAEEKQLADARTALTEGEGLRLGSERNYQKYLDRIQGLKDNVTLHEKNVEALKKELAGLK